MYVVQVLFDGKWGIVTRCVHPLADRAAFMTREESEAVLADWRKRSSWTLRLCTIWEGGAA